MVAILTQNKALVNISNFNSIYVDTIEVKDDVEQVVITDGRYIYGYYNTVNEAVEVIQWIAQSIGASTEPNTVIVIPLLSKGEEDHVKQTE